MLFEVGCLPTCTTGQPDVLPADMVRLTASLVQAHTHTHTETDTHVGADK